MGLAHEKKSYLQEKANLFEIGSINTMQDKSVLLCFPLSRSGCPFPAMSQLQ